MAQVIQPARIGRAACGQPVFPRLSPFPGACRETEYFCPDATAFQGARQYVGTDGGDADGPAAHGTGIIDQQRDYRVTEFRIALALEGKDMSGVDYYPGKPGRIEQTSSLFEIPGVGMPRTQPPLQQIGQQ